MAFFIVIGMAILGILLQLFYMAKVKKSFKNESLENPRIFLKYN